MSGFRDFYQGSLLDWVSAFPQGIEAMEQKEEINFGAGSSEIPVNYFARNCV